jgi:hypothetical protein
MKLRMVVPHGKDMLGNSASLSMADHEIILAGNSANNVHQFL